jgi:hypothetical protein
MKTDIKAKWVTALRSGEYKKGIYRLHTKDGRYCCLGVLCDLYRKETGHGTWMEYPLGGGNFYEFLNVNTMLPVEVHLWAKLTPYDIIKMQLVARNDQDLGRAYSFDDIATIIENHET